MLALSIPAEDRFFDDKADILDINGFAETWQFALRPGQAQLDRMVAAFDALADMQPESGPEQVPLSV